MSFADQFLKKTIYFRTVGILRIFILVILLGLSSCTTRARQTTPVRTDEIHISPSHSPVSPTPWIPSTTPTPTHTIPASATSTRTPSPTKTPTPSLTPSVTPTPAPLPVFSTRFLRAGVEASRYISDTCQYLSQRWSIDGSSPGTVVVPIMFHGVRGAGKNILEGDGTTITEEQFQSIIWYANQHGYQTITVEQLHNFLKSNSKIPRHSMIFIVDDRRPGTVENYFLPAAIENNWTVTLGWIISNTDQDLWAWMERLNASERLDIQSHGYNHVYITEQTSESIIREEVFNPIPILEQHFGKRPTAFIWPGGNFTPLAVTTAREAGYQIGFTAYSRGPLMFNWIPQGEEERTIADPLMTLPRSWSTDQTLPLYVGEQISDVATADAIEAYPREADYYRVYCGGELPSLNEIISITSP